MSLPRLVDLEGVAQRGRAAPSPRALLEFAFRPLYLAGVAWALIAVGFGSTRRNR